MKQLNNDEIFNSPCFEEKKEMSPQNDELSELDTDSIDSGENITQFIPPEILSHIMKLAGIVQTGTDTLVTVNLSTLSALSAGTIVFDKKEHTSGTVIIIYTAAFFNSGGGKTVAVGTNRRYFLDWREEELSNLQQEQDERIEQIQVELKSLGGSTDDRETKAKLEEELFGYKAQPDVYLEDATEEGFGLSIASGSTPMMFIDNFGKYLSASKNSEGKASMIRMLDNVFDSGQTTTRRLKGNNKRATQLFIKGFGAHFASTMGSSNLKTQDLKDNVENGFFNKVLITFQDTIDKPIPLETSLIQSDKDEIEKFARAYHAMAGECNFYLSDEAYEVYKVFHHEIDVEYRRRYNNGEDSAGLIIRLLKIAKRIACVFEIASECEQYSPMGLIEDNEDDIRPKEPISAENMSRAIGLIDYLKTEHTSKVVLYAQSKNGKISKVDMVLHKIQNINEKKRKDASVVINNRSIQSSFSKSQRMKVNELKPILKQLVHDGKIGGGTDGSYTLLS